MEALPVLPEWPDANRGHRQDPSEPAPQLLTPGNTLCSSGEPALPVHVCTLWAFLGSLLCFCMETCRGRHPLQQQEICWLSNTTEPVSPFRAVVKQAPDLLLWQTRRPLRVCAFTKGALLDLAVKEKNHHEFNFLLKILYYFMWLCVFAHMHT